MNSANLIGTYNNGFIVTKRTSDKYDYIRAKIVGIDTGERVVVSGSFRSENKDGHLLLYVEAKDVSVINDSMDYNDLLLDGYLCKPANYRVTPSGKAVVDIVLAVPDNDRTDFIPCVAWGYNAKRLQGTITGARVRLCGRMQSRNYNKNGMTHTAYEVSVNLLELL